MNIVQVTDAHLKNEEPFFRAGASLDDFIIKHIAREVKPFIFIDGGDRFHVSKETGRVNNEVIKFFMAVANDRNCEEIFVMQGNHDVKEETGSALDVIYDLHPKITVVDKPLFIAARDLANGEITGFIYLLPHMRPFSEPGYSSVKSYGDENFHRNFWKSRSHDWDIIKNRIKLISMHGGDETTGKFFMNADISFLPGLRSNGHVHKQVSKNHLSSVSVTRRDEIDKKCFIRHIDTENWEVHDIEIPLFLNYAQIPYGEDIDKYFESGVHIKPQESLIVDIYGHDDKDLVIAEYTEKWANRAKPKLYIGEVTPVERRGEAVPIEERDELDIGSIDIKELFLEFCEDKKLTKAVADDLLGRIA